MNTPERMIRVLIADDQSLILDGFSRIVNAQHDMCTIGTAQNGEEAVERTQELHPDVVLMDIRMPIVDGIEATRTIMAEELSPKTRVIGLTTYDTDAYAIRMLKAGAIGFILKDSTALQLVDAIRTAHNGVFTATMSTTQRLLRRITTATPRTPTDMGALDALTDRERAVFALVVAGRSNPEIARELSIAIVTVKTHVGHILTKLKIRDRVQLVIWAQRQGLADPLTAAARSDDGPRS